MIFSKESDGTLKKIDYYSIDKEKSLQNLIERNLQEILDIRFLATEYVTTSGGRFDTLGIDNKMLLLLLNIKETRTTMLLINRCLI